MASSRTAITEVSTLSSSGAGNNASNFRNWCPVMVPPAAVVVPPPEAEAMIESLTAASLAEIGSDAFMRSYCVDLERLALQAHLSASQSTTATPGSGSSSAAAAFGHEYIVETILVEGKVEALVRTLLALEVWRTRVLLLPDGIDNSDSKEQASGSEEKENAEDNNEAASDDIVVIESNGGVFDADGGGKVDDEKQREDKPAENDAAAATATPSTDSIKALSSTSCPPKGLAPLLADNKNSLRTAFILHAETTIVGLLALIFYRREAFDDLQSEVAIALVDYTARCMTALAVPVEANPTVRRQKHPRSATELADRIRTRTALEEIHDSVLDAQYKTSVTAVSLARYLCEHIDALPLSARSRILETHDFPIMIVPLIEEPPWTRRRTVSSCR